MHVFAGQCRYVYNRALAMQRDRYKAEEKKLGYAGLCKALTQWRNDHETSWLKMGSVSTQQQALCDLERAYINFFAGRASFPSFKRKGEYESFRFPNAKQFYICQGHSRIKLPKLGWVRYRNSRRIEGTPKNATVSLRAGKWYVSIQTEREVPEPVHPSRTMVGIDMGVARLATLSDSTVYEPLNSFKKHQRALANAQRAMSRKVKFSQNWRKAKARIQRIQARIANARRDYLHKASNDISKNHAVVVLEDLKVSNMSKSAKGTAEAPGKNVKAKSGLNKAILDQGWGEFRRQLEYKQKWRGGEVIAVNPRNTSRTCLQCGHVSADNRKTQARFKCISCGFEGHADLVAAENIRRAGHARIACGGEPVEAPVKQEPIETTCNAVQLGLL
ncbi:MAG: RNA-guided endonuclease InsQ/TnpB family protein [Bradymonadia bacterium]